MSVGSNSESGNQGTVFIAWTDRSGRIEDISSALGARPIAIYPRRFIKSTPLRYLASFFITLFEVVRARPGAVIATNPPAFCALGGWLGSLITRAVFVMDAHPVAFGAKDNAVGKALLPLTRFLSRRAATTLVTTDVWGDVLQGWGARSLVLHEAPPVEHAKLSMRLSFDDEVDSSERNRPRILYVGIFGGDEPVDVVVEAARLNPEFDLFVTGDTSRASQALLEGAPQNVKFVGYLNSAQYFREMELADVVCSFTTEPTSVMRAAYEAVYERKPLVITATPDSAELFPYAVRVENTVEEISDGWRKALANLIELKDSADRAREVQLARWNQQCAQLSAVLKS